MSKQKFPRRFPRRASGAPLSEPESAPESGSSPITVNDDVPSAASSSEFSTLVEILEAAVPDLPASIRKGLTPSYRRRTDWDSVESVHSEQSEDAEPSEDLASHTTEHKFPHLASDAFRAESSALADMLSAAIRPRSPSPLAEGLPPSYPTRTEPERVESLDRPPSGHVSIDDAAALRFVGRSLATVESCITLQAHSTGMLMPLAVRHVLKAEMARAAGLLHLLRFLKKDLSLVTTTVVTGAIVHRVLQSVEAERRLRGITLASKSSASDVSLVVDETLLANLLLGALLTTFALVDGIENPQVHLVVTRSDNGEVMMSVTQEQATAPHGWPTHPVGEAWADAAGGVLSAIAMSAGPGIAHAWGGRFGATAAERSTSISITLPVI